MGAGVGRGREIPARIRGAQPAAGRQAVGAVQFSDLGGDVAPAGRGVRHGREWPVDEGRRAAAIAFASRRRKRHASGNCLPGGRRGRVVAT
ncbi:hypothetical protein BC2230_20282 [Burkholderia cepacia]